METKNETCADICRVFISVKEEIRRFDCSDTIRIKCCRNKTISPDQWDVTLRNTKSDKLAKHQATKKKVGKDHSIVFPLFV